MSAPPLSIRDKHHISAAEGWLDLGDWRAANDELESVTPELQNPAALFTASIVGALCSHRS